ncbi:hypothetical protein ACFY5K_09720 [Streptomyces griseofuscus]|uniref:hypothetical protein n=1 Tax=Streptomyces TaxID=1883 RepID=UPI00081EEBF3|nr:MULTISPECIES: hypothetical protein [Streptomyces]MBA9048779.1 hypothetical protein [Streptomyces murinus]MBJ7004035.1 hypothetical protein [Streptomyces sp. CRPSP2-6A1]MYQ95661.1 hypothetical protein [Streptomyces sp. SID4946]MYR84418.1 hypothetical protein [Streptomyces sp. SID685]SCF78257.1 hypothetical protein GA0115258_112464 [Streptomyces sp. LamerLS-31b]
MIAIAAALAEIVLILVQRWRAPSGGPVATPWPHLAAALGAGVVGWLVIGRPDPAWDEVSLAVITGVILGSEAARSARVLSGKEWAGWATACGSGAASATWLLATPLPFM